MLNISGRFAPSGGSLLVGPPQQWVEELAEMTLTHGITGYFLVSDDAATTETFAGEVAPALRELVAAER